MTRHFANRRFRMTDRLLGDLVLPVEDNFDMDWAIDTLNAASVDGGKSTGSTNVYDDIPLAERADGTGATIFAPA